MAGGGNVTFVTDIRQVVRRQMRLADVYYCDVAHHRHRCRRQQRRLQRHQQRPVETSAVPQRPPWLTAGTCPHMRRPSGRTTTAANSVRPRPKRGKPPPPPPPPPPYARPTPPAP